MRLARLKIVSLTLCFSLNVFASDYSDSSQAGGAQAPNQFPWQMMVQQGQLSGCIYASQFYSSGAILLAETLPRKCRLNAYGNGYWADLSERELELYQASLDSRFAS